MSSNVQPQAADRSLLRLDPLAFQPPLPVSIDTAQLSEAPPVIGEPLQPAPQPYLSSEGLTESPQTRPFSRYSASKKRANRLASRPSESGVVWNQNGLLPNGNCSMNWGPGGLDRFSGDANISGWRDGVEADGAPILSTAPQQVNPSSQEFLLSAPNSELPSFDQQAQPAMPPTHIRAHNIGFGAYPPTSAIPSLPTSSHIPNYAPGDASIPPRNPYGEIQQYSSTQRLQAAQTQSLCSAGTEFLPDSQMALQGAQGFEVALADHTSPEPVFTQQTQPFPNGSRTESPLDTPQKPDGHEGSEHFRGDINPSVEDARSHFQPSIANNIGITLNEAYMQQNGELPQKSIVHDIGSLNHRTPQCPAESMLLPDGLAGIAKVPNEIFYDEHGVARNGTPEVIVVPSTEEKEHSVGDRGTQSHPPDLVRHIFQQNAHVPQSSQPLGISMNLDTSKQIFQQTEIVQVSSSHEQVAPNAEKPERYIAPSSAHAAPVKAPESVEAVRTETMSKTSIRFRSVPYPGYIENPAKSSKGNCDLLHRSPLFSEDGSLPDGTPIKPITRPAVVEDDDVPLGGVMDKMRSALESQDKSKTSGALRQGLSTNQTGVSPGRRGKHLPTLDIDDIHGTRLLGPSRNVSVQLTKPKSKRVMKFSDDEEEKPVLLKTMAANVTRKSTRQRKPAQRLCYEGNLLGKKSELGGTGRSNKQRRNPVKNAKARTLHTNAEQEIRNVDVPQKSGTQRRRKLGTVLLSLDYEETEPQRIPNANRQRNLSDFETSDDDDPDEDCRVSDSPKPRSDQGTRKSPRLRAGTAKAKQTSYFANRDTDRGRKRGRQQKQRVLVGDDDVALSSPQKRKRISRSNSRVSKPIVIDTPDRSTATATKARKKSPKSSGALRTSRRKKSIDAVELDENSTFEKSDDLSGSDSDFDFPGPRRRASAKKPSSSLDLRGKRPSSRKKPESNSAKSKRGKNTPSKCKTVKKRGTGEGDGTSSDSETNAEERSPSQEYGSQPLEIKKVGALKQRRSRKKKFSEQLFKRMTPDELSIIRIAFVKHYPVPPSNMQAHARFEHRYGAEMTEEMKKGLWEKELKPWGERWWRFYTDFNDRVREKKLEKSRDRDPKVTETEVAVWAREFYDVHGDARIPFNDGDTQKRQAQPAVIQVPSQSQD